MWDQSHHPNSSVTLIVEGFTSLQRLVNLKWAIIWKLLIICVTKVLVLLFYAHRLMYIEATDSTYQNWNLSCMNFRMSILISRKDAIWAKGYIAYVKSIWCTSHGAHFEHTVNFDGFLKDINRRSIYVS